MVSRRSRTRPSRAARPGVGGLLAVAVAATALLAAACGPPPTIEASGAGPVEADNLPECPMGALDAADGVTEIVVWHALGAESLTALEDMTKRYNAGQDKVKVTLQSQGADYEEVLRKYTQAASSGKGAPAVVYLEDTTIQTVIDTGTLFPAEACAEETGFDLASMNEAARNYYTVDDVFYPGYVNVSEPVLYFNRTHFRNAGLDNDNPPETLDEVRTAAEALKQSGIDKPLALKLEPWFFTCWVNGAGETIVNPDNGRSGPAEEANLVNPASIEALQWMQDMVADGLADPISDTPGQINQYLNVAQEKSSMLIETSTAATSIKAFLGGDLDTGGQDASSVDTEGLDPAATPFPGLTEPGQVRVSGGYFGISNRVPEAQQAAGADYLAFMAEPEQVVEWHITGSYLPVLGDVSEDPQIQKFWEEDRAGQMLKVAYETLSLVDPSQPGPLIGPYPEYVSGMQKAIEASARSGEDPEAALKKANDQLNKDLENYYG
ncbi:MAG: extracellular solute-binding protein [Microthrixaceae bacterium]